MKYCPWCFCQQKKPNVIMANDNEIISLSLELQHKIQMCLSYSTGTKLRKKFGSKRNWAFYCVSLNRDSKVRSFCSKSLLRKSLPFSPSPSSFPLHLLSRCRLDNINTEIQKSTFTSVQVTGKSYANQQSCDNVLCTEHLHSRSEKLNVHCWDNLRNTWKHTYATENYF